MAAPLKFPDVKEFQDKAAGFYTWCKDDKSNGYDMQLIPTIEAFAVFMGVDRHTIVNYEDKDGYASTIKSIRAREAMLVKNGGLTGKYRDAMSIFSLKNMGYSDRVELEVDGTIDIKMEGLDDLIK